MGKLFVMDHPLIQDKVTKLRDINTSSKEFRELASEISMLIAYEATRDFPLRDVTVKTPVAETTSKKLAGKKVAVIPILRAGLGMVDGFMSLIPSAKIGHIGVYRDHDTLQPIEYYAKLPKDIEMRQVIVVDPMLATGNSSIHAINYLKKNNVKDIKFACIISCPEGVKALQEAHPDIDIFVAVIDEKLNEDAYIVPGLGDAGDRLFGTK